MKAKILLVDDNEMNRDMLSRRLGREGYEVTLAEGGREALAAIAPGRFDLVLCDIMMPDVSGLTVLETLRKQYSIADLPIIMVTARNESEDVVEALKRGANDYITKPIDFPVLLARVRTALALRALTALKDEFLRIASHDLKNPLTEVLGISSLVETMVPVGTPMPQNMYNLVVNIKKAARKMQFIIEDFLDFQALEDGVLRLSEETIDLNAIARDATETSATYAQGKQITLTLELAPALPPLYGDPRRLAQVVQNLVDNAIKFSPKGGAARVRTACRDDRARLEVIDAGPGLKDEDFARAFQKYATLSNAPTAGEKSSGLGLAICKQLIEAHGGTIGVANNPAGGATFWFELPRDADAGDTAADG